jgi:hypothetical protein
MAQPSRKFFQGMGAFLALPALFKALMALSAKLNHKMAASMFLDRKPELHSMSAFPLEPSIEK